MTGVVRIERCELQAKGAIASLMQLYLYDLCEFEDGPLDEKGQFDLGAYFELYWTEPERHPFLIWVDGELAGFALVREMDAEAYSLTEFFIRRGRRRAGLGAIAATQLFDQFRGNWQVAELANNLPAQTFWRRVIERYSEGRVSEEWSESEPKGPMQVFSNKVVE